MSLSSFFRGSFGDLWIGLSASETLGLVDGVSLVEDYFGVGGRVTLCHVASGVRVAVPVTVWGSTSRDLGGRVGMASLKSGEYRIEGRVVDLRGNIASLSLGFLLLDGPAPLNGGVVLSPGAPDAPMVVMPSGGPSVLAVLRPGAAVSFPSCSPPSVEFQPFIPSVRF